VKFNKLFKFSSKVWFVQKCPDSQVERFLVLLRWEQSLFGRWKASADFSGHSVSRMSRFWHYLRRLLSIELSFLGCLRRQWSDWGIFSPPSPLSLWFGQAVSSCLLLLFPQAPLSNYLFSSLRCYHKHQISALSRIEEAHRLVLNEPEVH
jgi:hypothetical protein